MSYLFKGVLIYVRPSSAKNSPIRLSNAQGQTSYWIKLFVCFVGLIYMRMWTCWLKTHSQQVPLKMKWSRIFLFLLFRVGSNSSTLCSSFSTSDDDCLCPHACLTYLGETFCDLLSPPVSYSYTYNSPLETLGAVYCPCCRSLLCS